MFDSRFHTKAEIKKLFSNLRNKKITDEMAAALIDSLWRDPVNLRTSGFLYPGAIDVKMTWDDATRTLLLEPRTDGDGTPTEETIPLFRFFTWENNNKPALHRRGIWIEEENELPNPDKIQLPDTHGLHVVFYDWNEERSRYELTALPDPDFDTWNEIYTNKVIVAAIYWDFAGQQALYLGENKHGSEFNPTMHYFEHLTLNSRRERGLFLSGLTPNGDGSEDEHFQFGISAGFAWHEDIRLAVDAVSNLDGLPVWWFPGAAAQYSFAQNKFLLKDGLAAYDDGGTLTAAQDGNFVLTHYFATNCLLHPLIAAAGRAEYETFAEAAAAIRAEVDTLKHALPHTGLLHIDTVILQTSLDYENSAHTRVVTRAGAETFLELLDTPNSYEGQKGRVPKVNDDETALEFVDFPDNDGSGGECQDGITPHIGPNGNWYIGDTDTGVKAKGEDGKSVELQTASGYVQWRQTGGSWANLFKVPADGDPGQNAFLYVAYASDDQGSDFSLIPSNSLKYRAEIQRITPLVPPVAGDFSGATWVKYIGDDGQGSGGGGGDDNPELHIDFEESGDEFTYNVPYKMKFTVQTSENSDASLSEALNSTLERYDRLTITATAAGLVSLYGEYID